jgi:hypothetical protein
MRLTPMELLALLYTVGGAVVGLLFGGRVGAFVLTIVALTALLALTAIVFVRLGLNPGLARALAGITLTFIVYSALPPLLELRMDGRIDQQLWELERAILGTTAVELVEPYTSVWLTLFFAAVYTLHAPLFFVPAILHWRAGRRDRAERLLLALAMQMYVGFLGYAIWPALGPVGTIEGLRPLGENPALYVVAEYGVDLGTVPSIHAAICATVAIDAWRTSRRWAIVFTAIAVGIWASTIYLRYHWVPDLFAGLLLAVAAYWLSGKMRPITEVRE